MEMQGSRPLAATQEQAWEALNDPDVLRACIPGCEKVERAGDDRYTVAMAVKVGPVSPKFAGKITLSDVQPPHSYTLAFEGQGGAAGFGKGTSHVRLTPAGTGCELAYTVNAQVGGRIAQVGQRLIDGVARSMAEDFFKRFEEELQRRHPAVAAAPSPDPEGATPVTAATPVQAVEAAVATHPERGASRKWLWIGVALVLAAAVAWLAD